MKTRPIALAFGLTITVISITVLLGLALYLAISRR